LRLFQPAEHTSLVDPLEHVRRPSPGGGGGRHRRRRRLHPQHHRAGRAAASPGLFFCYLFKLIFYDLNIIFKLFFVSEINFFKYFQNLELFFIYLKVFLFS
jgi:hypothetical protein